MSLPFEELSKMKEGFWWGFVGVCIKKKISFKEVPFEHFSRQTGEAGYKLTSLPGIILRNFIGLLKRSSLLAKNTHTPIIKLKIKKN